MKAASADSQHSDGRRHHHRSNEVHEVLANKAHCYMDYRRGGGYAVSNGGSPEEQKRYPFRALFVLKNAERRNSVAARLLMNNPPIGSQVWLTTLHEITDKPLGAIWIRPPDYRQVTRGTAFDPYADQNRGAYRSRPEREELIERTIPKQNMLSM